MRSSHVLASSPSAAAVACGVSLFLMVDAAVALDIASRPVPELDGPRTTQLRLVLSGRINHGDADKVAAKLATIPVEQLDGVVLNSPGGVVGEGQRIGEMFRYLMVRVIVREPFRCVSACFFLYAGASMRMAYGPPQAATLWVHRGFVRLDSVDSISTEMLERMLVYEQEELPRWLADQGVPHSIIAVISQGSVQPLTALGQSDIDLMGPRSPAYDAWIEARCVGSGKLALWTVRELPPQVPRAELADAQERRQCEIKRVEAERRYLQSALKTALGAGKRWQAMR